MNRHLLFAYLIAVTWGAFMMPDLAHADIITKDFWDYTAAEFGDGREATFFDAKNKGGEPPKTSGWIEYAFEVPSMGWYTLWFKDWGGLTHELIIDGERVYFGGVVGNPGEPLPKEEGRMKSANLPLTAGSHTLRIQRLGRVGFPGGFPSGWALKPADGPEDRISAEIVGHDVVRRGESVKLQLTAGMGPAISCEVIAHNLLTDQEVVLTTITFDAATEVVTKTVELPATAEGIYRLQARADGKELLPAEFRAGDMVVIDTKAAPQPGAEQRTLVVDIDCVAQTMNGKPISADTFKECNGATRVVDGPLGKYRESNDCTGPEAAKWVSSHEFPKAFSGFSYTVQLPDVSSTYLLEVEYPDDAWRHITFPVIDFGNPAKPDAPVDGYAPPGGGVMTGGIFPLTNSLQTYRSVFWINEPNVLIGAVSQRLGFRAAATRIRVYRFDAPLPPASANRDDGRIYLGWHEQADDWDMTANLNQRRNKEPDAVLDYIGLSRWVAVAAYNGMNGIGPSDVSYQGVYWRSKELVGFMPRDFDMSRMACLLCEKYGMKYIPNIFLAQIYFEMIAMDRLVENPDDVRTWSWQGLRGGTDVQWTTHNILHPAVQQKIINIEGELADLLRDSPAFKGIGSRLITWIWEGHWAVTSIYWGYGDWTVAEFTKDTGIAVPGKAGDPDRFSERFNFLTDAAHKDAWIKWRTDRVTDFYKRLIARVQGDRPDLTVYLQGGEAVDRVHREDAQGKTDRVRLLGMGLDLDRLEELDGFALIPIHNPGRGKCKSPLAEQKWYDIILDPKQKALAVGSEHGFQFWPQYDEWGHEFPLDRLGVPAFKTGKRGRHYVGTTTGAGRYDLERLAVVLADTDATLFMDGSFRINHGDRDVRGPWIAEFKQLPRKPFNDVPGASDPVAVRQLQDEGWLYFYAVNREQVALTTDIALAGIGKLTRLGTGEELTVEDGVLQLTLAPFELASFRARLPASVVGAHTAIPPERNELVRDRLSFAQRISEQLAKGKSGATEDQIRAYQMNLEDAWQAYREGHIWRARTALSMAPMLAVYQLLGDVPEGQVATTFPQLLQNYETEWHFPAEPFYNAQDLQAWLVEGSKDDTLVDSATYNPRWRYTQVLKSADGQLDIDIELPGAGPYQVTLGHVSSAAGPLLVSLGGQRLAVAAQVDEPNMPGQTAFPLLSLPAGKARLSIRSAGSFGVYALKVVPKLKPLNSPYWSTIGPFVSTWNGGRADDDIVHDSMAKEYPPEGTGAIDFNLTCQNARGAALAWTQTDLAVGDREDRGVNFVIRCKSPGRDVCYGATTITSPDDRDVLFLLGVDWWGNLWCNGELVKTDLDAKTQEKLGIGFTTFKPRPVVLHLKKGANTLMVKVLGGSLGSSFAAWMIDQPDLIVTPTPQD